MWTDKDKFWECYNTFRFNNFPEIVENSHTCCLNKPQSQKKNKIKHNNKTEKGKSCVWEILYLNNQMM